jgi:hypothetical protein
MKNSLEEFQVECETQSLEVYFSMTYRIELVKDRLPQNKRKQILVVKT